MLHGHEHGTDTNTDMGIWQFLKNKDTTRRLNINSILYLGIFFNIFRHKIRLCLEKEGTEGKVTTRFSNLDSSLNRKREMFKVFEVESGSNRDDVIINLIIN